MLEVMAAEMVWVPTVAKVTVNFVGPERLPKLTKNDFGEKAANGSLAFKMTVYEPLSKPQPTLTLPGIATPVFTVFAAVGAGGDSTGQAGFPGSA